MKPHDFPKTLLEFQERFNSDEACAEYLMERRWPSGIRCPRCQSESGYSLPRRNLWQCKKCQYQTSITAGTVLHRSRQPLRHWFWSVYLMATTSNGISALQLQKQLGIGSYQTAWSLCHKLRRAMVRPDRELLSGVTEVDETYVGAPEEGLPGRQTEKKSLVVAAIEVCGSRAGRLRMAAVPDASGESLGGFVRGAITPGSTVRTDGWNGYSSLKKNFDHVIVEGEATVALKWIHLAFSNLKTWLLGTYHGIGPEHMQNYLDEYVFRFNRRFSRAHAFWSLLGIALDIKPQPYKELISHPDEEW